MEKSITFYQYTVICDVLRPIKFHVFCKNNTNCIKFFAFSNLKKLANLRLSSNVQKPKVF